MLIEKDIKQILNHLADGDQVDIPFDGSDITIRSLDASSKLSLSTLVYEGSNYIPPSVRSSLSHPSRFAYWSIPTFLSIDEQNFQIRLNYLGQAQPLNHYHFKVLLEEFSLLAEKWRTYLDDQDKNDLVYIKVK